MIDADELWYYHRTDPRPQSVLQVRVHNPRGLQTANRTTILGSRPGAIPWQSECGFEDPHLLAWHRHHAQHSCWRGAREARPPIRCTRAVRTRLRLLCPRSIQSAVPLVAEALRMCSTSNGRVCGPRPPGPARRLLRGGRRDHHADPAGPAPSRPEPKRAPAQRSWS